MIGAPTSTRISVPRLLLTGGGTAGHVYPALSVLSELDTQPSWIGSLDGLERALVERAGIPFRGIQSGAVLGRGPIQLAASALRNAHGFAQARAMLLQARPSVVLATGGYVSVPTVLAAKSLGLPSAILLPDVQPGLAVRALSHVVDRVACSTEGTRRYLPAHKVVACGYPVRAELRAWAGRRGEARRRLGLPEEGRVLLVMGGSRGALRINRAVWSALDRLTAAAAVVHLTGEQWIAEAADRAGDRYRPMPFAHDEMALLLAASDVVICRAGASTLGELPAFGLPGLLIPGSFAAGHQHANAAYLAEAGAASVFDDARLEEPGALAAAVEPLLDDDERLRAMSAAARVLDRPDAAACVARMLATLARRDPR